MHTASDEPGHRWMSLKEAIAHLRARLSVSELSAQVEIKKQIRIGALPVKWADAADSKDRPNIEELARSQFVLSGPGLAPDEVDLRPLLLLRADVIAIRVKASEALTAEHSRNRLPNEATDWMSLVEAVEHIQLAQSCDSVEALRQLKVETKDGMVRTRWADRVGQGDDADPQKLC